MTLLLLQLLHQLESSRALVIGAGDDDDIKQRHGSNIRRAEGGSCDGSQKKFVGKLSDRRNQCIRDTHAVRTLGASLTQAFHRLPQAATMADGNDQITFPEQTNFVYNFRRRSGTGDWQPQNDEQMFQKIHQVGSQIAAQQDNLSGSVKPPHQSGDAARLSGLNQAVQTLDVLVERGSYLRRNGGFPCRTGLNGIQ